MKVKTYQDLYPFWYFERIGKDRLYELLSIKINKKVLPKQEQKELDTLKIKYWRN